MLELESVTSGYARRAVLCDITARFAKGRFTALLGPNGCGKSTLLKSVLGLVEVTSGQLRLDGADLRGMALRQRARRLAYMPQEVTCPDYLTLGELVAMGGYARRSLLGAPEPGTRAACLRAIEAVGLGDQAAAQVNALSGGQRQRAFIAMILAQDTDVVLLDEPVNHLDITYQYTTMELVRALVRDHGKTVVAVLHDLNLALRFADEALLLHEGRCMAAGPVADVIKPQTLNDAFALDAEIITHNGHRLCVPRQGQTASQGRA